MITIQGKGVSKGIAKGPLYFFQRPNTTVTLTVVSDVESEKARLAAAQEQSIQQLNALAEKCQDDAGEEMAGVLCAGDSIDPADGESPDRYCGA